MKNQFLVVIGAIFLTLTSVKADTEYVDIPLLTAPEVAAQILTKWEKENHDKKIISVTTNIGPHIRQQYSVVYGFWVTFEYRKPAVEEKK